ncbi:MULTISPECIES: HlyD family type I secretion periplasmic adaptor subunit [unclassified Acidovorax]|uniref:HlyD family type I secretion periplasmic adaptor subunit n=1 Tax=unclassified Acidovorax TaxID=2684926 RepID=UPI00070D8380|nr:HlyD family type I secretion periplasmic adaptor subunit [Acidovorax sp. Root219]KRC30234.1 secretion protein HlyD [Acidovorax sp. Root219]
MVKSLFPLNKKPDPSLDGNDAVALPAAGDSGRAGRMGLWALAIGFGGFLLWASLAPLDEGVPAAGIVAIDTKRKAVQHLSGGIVKEVLVREGDEVKEGQLLIRLDSAVARANYESVRQRYLGLRAMQGRLLAEQGGLASISFHADLQAAGSDPLIRQQMQNQEQLFMTRRSLLRSDLQSIEESIQGQEGLLQAYDGMLASRKSQLSLINEELGNLRGLVKEGYAPRNRQLEMERMVADSTTGIADLQGNTIRARRTIGELRQRALSRQQEYRKEVESSLAEVSREVLSDNEKLHAVTDDLGRTEIKAPASGQVVSLAIQTVGGVIAPGQKLMDIVPKDASLLLEAHVAPHLIDRVHSELPVDVRFSSFAHSPQLVVNGKVVSISADLLAEPQTNVSYYLARIQVTPEGMKKLGKRQLQPGMPVEVIFKTGERSMLTYLLHPLTKRLAASMTEE